jgi:hypothetical protein
LKNLVRLLPESVVRIKPVNGSVLNHKGQEGGRKKKDTRRCFQCGKVGHLKKSCPELNRSASHGRDDGHVLIMTCPGDASVLHDASVKCGEALVTSDCAVEVLLDSAITHHTVNDIAQMSECEPPKVPQIVDGGGRAHEVLCKVTVLLYGGPNGPVCITNVLLVLTIQRNLLRVSKLTEKRASVRMSDSSVCFFF